MIMFCEKYIWSKKCDLCGIHWQQERSSPPKANAEINFESSFGTQSVNLTICWAVDLYDAFNCLKNEKNQYVEPFRGGEGSMNLAI